MGMTTATKCWTCANAVPNEKYGCNWSRCFEPVYGWTAEKTVIGRQNNNLPPVNSYCVEKCPEYKSMKEREPCEFDDMAVKRFAIAVIRHAIKNYYNGAYESLEKGEKTNLFTKSAIFLSTQLCQEYGEMVDISIDYVVEKAKAKAKYLYSMPVLTNAQIKKLMRKKGLTQKEVSQRLGRADTYLHEFMKRKNQKAEIRTRKEIAIALELTEKELKEVKK